MTVDEQKCLVLIEKRLCEFARDKVSGSIEIHIASGKMQLVRTIRTDKITLQKGLQKT